MSDHTSQTSKDFIQPRMDDLIPERIIFFCDCNAKFDSPESLNGHAANCAHVLPFVEGSRYPTRDGVILLAEKMTRSAFQVLPGTEDFFLLVRQLVRVEFVRRQGKAPTGVNEMHELLFAAEVDRLTLMYGIASRAERMSVNGRPKMVLTQSR